MDKWANWTPILTQGAPLSYVIDKAEYLIYCEWAKIRGLLTLDSVGVRFIRVEIGGLPEPISNWLAFGDVMLTCSGVHYIQQLWSNSDGVLIFGRYGDTPLCFGENPDIGLKSGDTVRFEASLTKKGVLHPNIPANLDVDSLRGVGTRFPANEWKPKSIWENHITKIEYLAKDETWKELGE